MAAQQSPKDEPKEPKEVKDFRAAYEEALVHARISAEHTATEGWQNLYCEHQQRIQKGREEISDRLKPLVEVMRLRFLTEDEERSLSEIKKEITELREDDESFRFQVIEPVIAPMSECNKVMEEYRAAARQAERNAPLHTRGLVEIMETVIDTVSRVKFITGTGRLTVG